MGQNSPGQLGPNQASVFGFLWRGTKSAVAAPLSTFPVGQIQQNALLIRDLARKLRRRPISDPRVLRTEDGQLDMLGTEFDLGLSPRALQARVASRRRQTARLAYASLMLGCVFLILWIYHALASGSGGPRIIGVLQFVPFCAIFFLVAFKNAHVNWQLRTGQVGSASDYLHSPEQFWPH